MKPSDKVLKLAMVTGELLRRAQSSRNEKVANQSRVQQLIPQAVSALVKHARIEEHQAKEVTAALNDHAVAIELLTKVAKHRNAEEQIAIGKPQAEKTAAAIAESKRALGQRPANWDETPEGRKFRERLGLL